MQVCTSLQTDNHACTPQLIFYRPDALLAAQPTASKALKARIHTQTANYHISAFSNSDEMKTNHLCCNNHKVQILQSTQTRNLCKSRPTVRHRDTLLRLAVRQRLQVCRLCTWWQMGHLTLQLLLPFTQLVYQSIGVLQRTRLCKFGWLDWLE